MASSVGVSSSSRTRSALESFFTPASVTGRAEPRISQISTEKKHQGSVQARMLFVVKSNDEDPRFRLR